MSTDDFKILFLAGSKMIDVFIRKNTLSQIDTINVKEDFYNQFENIKEVGYDCIFCGPELGIPFCLEVGQLISNECSNTPLYFTLENSQIGNYNFSDLKKNGFTEIFTYPFDTINILRSLLNIRKNIIWSDQCFMPIRLSDIEIEKELSFDVFMYMPRNNKYIKFVNKGAQISTARFNRMMQKEITNMFVRFKDGVDFLKYNEQKFSSISGHKNAGSICYQFELEDGLKKIFTELLGSEDKDVGQTQNLINKCKSLTQQFYKNKEQGQTNLYADLLNHTGYISTEYTHASKVAIVASILSNYLKIGNPEDIAIAGLFHDASLWKRNEDFHYKHNLIQNYDIGTTYLEHPEETIKLLRKKNMVINQEVSKIIADHHEKADGTGFPSRKNESHIHPGAQLLSFADQLIYLTSTYEGHRGTTILQAMDIIESNKSINAQFTKVIREHILLNIKTNKAA